MLFGRAEARRCRGGGAVPLYGWMFPNLGGFGMTLSWNAKMCPDARVAMSDPLSFSLADDLVMEICLVLSPLSIHMYERGFINFPPSDAESSQRRSRTCVSLFELL